jgi:hypothetical protein
MTFNQLHPSPRLPLVAGAAALALLALMIGTSPSKLCYDEPPHLDLAKSVVASGWRAALTSPDNQSAAGPLYTAIHIAASPLTGFHAPAIRWVNLICLALVMITVSRTDQRKPARPDWIPAVSMLSVPFLWPAAGTAVTELPALAAFAFFVYAMLHLLRVPDERASAWPFGWAALAGLALGLSILGRQTYLVVLPVVVGLFFAAPRKWLLWLVCLAVAISCCAWLFVLWHGLVPPRNQHYVDAGLRFDYGVLSVSYVAAATLFVSPRWLKIRNWKVALGLLFVGIALAVFTRDFAKPPAKSLLLTIFGGRWGLRVGFCIGVLFTSVAVVWVWNTLVIAWRERRDTGRAFLFLSLFALVAAPMKISHQFSSLYVVGLLSLLPLVLRDPQASVYWCALRIGFGSLAGAALLWIYFHP